jgi:O-antigen ligase
MPLRAILILSVTAIACFVTLKKPFWGLCFFAFINYIRPERFSYNYLAPMRISLIVSIIILIGWLINYKRIGRSSKYSITVFSLFGLGIVQVVTSFFARYDSAIALDWAISMVKIAVYCFLMTRLIDSEKKLTLFVVLNLGVVGFLSIWGIEQHFRGNPRLEDMAGGQFNEGNSMAALWVLTVPFFLVMALKGRVMLRTIGMVMSGALVASIVFTQSRAGFLGLAVAFLVLFIGVSFRSKIWIGLIGLFLFGIFNLATLSTVGYETRIKEMTIREQAGGRYEIWKAVIAAFGEYPVSGVGPQNFQYLAKTYFAKLKLPIFKQRADAHNTPLLILVEGGIFAFFFYSLSIFCFFGNLYSLRKASMKDSSLKGYRPWFVAFGAGMLGFLTCAMTHSYPYYEPFYWFLVIPSIARTLYIKEKKKRQLAEVTANSTLSI